MQRWCNMHRGITRRVQLPLAIITVHKDVVYSITETKLFLFVKNSAQLCIP